MRAMAKRLTFVIALAIVLSPQLASACAVCMTGKEDETRVAFIVTTAFMTFLPLGLIGGFVWWLRRRALAMQPIEPPRSGGYRGPRAFGHYDSPRDVSLRGS